MFLRIANVYETFYQKRSDLSKEAFQPKFEKAVVDNKSLGLSINNFFVCKTIQRALHATGSWKIVLPDKLTALRTGNQPFLGNGLDYRELVIGQKAYQFFVLHGVAVDDVSDGLVSLFLLGDVFLSLVQPIEDELNVACDSVEALIDILEYLWADAALLLLKKTTGKCIVYLFM